MSVWRYLTVEARALSTTPPCEAIDLDFRAYAYSEGKVFWELNCVVEALVSNRKAVKVSNEIQKHRPMWQAVCADIGLPWAEHYQPSIHQCRTDPSLQATPYTRSVQCVSTALLLLILLVWCSGRRRVVAERGRAVIAAWLQRCMPVMAAGVLDIAQILRGASGFCSGVGEQGYCEHLAAVAQLTAHVCWPHPIAQLTEALLLIFPVLAVCRGGKQALLVLILHAQRNLDLHMCDGNAFEVDVHKIKVRRGTKRKRPADDTYRFGLLRDFGRLRKARHNHTILKLDGYHSSTKVRWIAKDVASYMYTCAREFSEPPRVLGLYQDGARLGNPAKEHMLYVGWHYLAAKGCVLPPQARPGDA